MWNSEVLVSSFDAAKRRDFLGENLSVIKRNGGIRRTCLLDRIFVLSLMPSGGIECWLRVTMQMLERENSSVWLMDVFVFDGQNAG